MASVIPLVAPDFDVERWRADFPILAEQVHGQPLAYLDNAATTHTPRAVQEALADFEQRDRSNIHRGVHELSGRATDAYERARERVRAFINAPSARDILFLRGTTEAINLVAQTFGRTQIGAGDEIILSQLEHHSNIVPWQLLADQTGALLRVIPIDELGMLDLGAYQHLLGPRTRLVAVTHVSNALGTINPIKQIVGLAHKAGVPVLLDGAQAVPHLAVDVAAIGCDFYAFSGHKLYGPTGIGVLYGRAALLDALPPYQGGGGMIRSVSFERTTYARSPERFEAGTPNVAGAIGLAAALDYIERIGLTAIAEHEERLRQYAESSLADVPGLRVIGSAPKKAAVISFVLDGVHPHDLGTVLDRQGIAVRAGHHCAQPTMAHFGLPATTRASFGLYNTSDEIDRLVTGLHRARQVFVLG